MPEDYGNEGEVISTIGTPAKRTFVVDGTSKTGLEDRPTVKFEQWVCDEVLNKGHKNLDKETVKITVQNVHNRAKRLYPDDVRRKSVDRIAKRVLDWVKDTGYNPFKKAEVANPTRSVVKRPSAVPEKFRQTDKKRASKTKVTETVLPAEDLDLEGVSEENQAAALAVIEKIAIASVSLVPFPTRAYLLTESDEAWDVAADKLESCKILQCPKIGIKPKHVGEGPLQENNQLTVCCLVPEEKLKASCPQERPFTSLEQELYDTIVGDIGSETARKTIFKIRAKVKSQSFSGGKSEPVSSTEKPRSPVEEGSGSDKSTVSKS